MAIKHKISKRKPAGKHTAAKVTKAPLGSGKSPLRTRKAAAKPAPVVKMVGELPTPLATFYF